MASSFDIEVETPSFENLAKLAENLVYRLPGCTDLMIRKTLQDVYRDFCRRSCCLLGRRHFKLSPGQRSFAAPALFGGVVDAVASVTYDRRVLKAPRDFSIANGSSPMIFLAPRWVPAEDCPSEALPVVEVMTMEIPALNSEQVPIGFLDLHGESICSGVLSRLMSMTGKAWTDVQQAADERIRYENAINEERVRYYAGDRTGSGELSFLPDTSVLI